MILPVKISLKNWAASLIIDFPRDNIPILTDESQWKDWGNKLILETSFANLGSPSTMHFNSWSDWASAVYNVMQNV